MSFGVVQVLERGDKRFLWFSAPVVKENDYLHILQKLTDVCGDGLTLSLNNKRQLGIRLY
jgi:hypothetical protein